MDTASVGVTRNGVSYFFVFGSQFDDAAAGKLSNSITVHFLPWSLVGNFWGNPSFFNFLVKA